MARQYKRDKNGRFVSSSGSVAKVTTGRAGGFANSQFRSRVQTARAATRANATKGALADRRRTPASIARAKQEKRKRAVKTAVAFAAASPAARRLSVSASVVGVATAINVGVGARRLGTRRGRGDLQKRYNQRQLANLLASERNLANLRSSTRAIVARPGGGGSKSGRPTLRYAASNIKGPSARLRLNSAKRALSGRI